MSKPINSATKQAWHAIFQEAVEIEYEQNDDYLGMEKEDAIQLIKQEMANWSFAKFNRFVEENFDEKHQIKTLVYPGVRAVYRGRPPFNYI